MDLKYFGKKNETYLNALLQLLPRSSSKAFVDACMGSGAFTKKLSTGMMGTGAKAVAFELDPTMYTLHKMAVQHPIELIEAIEKKDYSKKTFEESLKRCKDVIDGVIGNTTKDEQMETAVAAYCSIYLSFNSMRSFYRSLTTYQKEADPVKRAEKKKQQAQVAVAFKENIHSTISTEYLSLKNVDIRNESFLDSPELFECPDNLIYLDVPYPLDQRDSSGANDDTEKKKEAKKKKQDKLAEDGKAGYLMDWTDDDHKRFLNLVENAVKTGHPAKMIICANFTVDAETGELMDLAKNKYNELLLPLGFRLVVVTNTESSVNSKDNWAVPKVEVVWINYEDIIGRWDDLNYFDYKDIYE